MVAKIKRKIVKIDEEKCNGCGVCIPACAEGALRIVDGKARLISEKYCDGLGACLGECPQDAISVIEAEAEDFDEKAVEQHLQKEEEKKLPCGCASATVQQFEKAGTGETDTCCASCQPSMLGHWPVQLTLVPPGAPFLKGADVLLTADCVPFAYSGFHQDFLKNHAVLVACPKLDDFQAHLKKLIDILRSSDIETLTVIHMEVPCCSGLVYMAKQAIQASGKNIPLQDITIGMQGKIKR